MELIQFSDIPAMMRDRPSRPNPKQPDVKQIRESEYIITCKKLGNEISRRWTDAGNKTDVIRALMYSFFDSAFRTTELKRNLYHQKLEDLTEQIAQAYEKTGSSAKQAREDLERFGKNLRWFIGSAMDKSYI